MFSKWFSLMSLSRLPTPVLVYVDGEKVGFGQAAGDFCACHSHTEAYFEDFRSAASETGIKIYWCCLVVDAEAVP